LNAKVERCHVYNSDNRDEIYNKITITYKDDMKRLKDSNRFFNKDSSY